MSKRVILVGDPTLGLKQLSENIQSKFHVYNIAFIDKEEVVLDQLSTNWELVDFRDFHELTMRIMEIEPDVLVYLSPFFPSYLCNQYPEHAYIANSEVVEHFHEILGIHNTHLIFLSLTEIQNDEQLSGKSIQISSFSDGELYLHGMNKSTIVRLPELINYSNNGFLAWYQEYKPDINPKIVTLSFLSEQIVEIIVNNKFGTIELVEDRLNNISLKKFENIPFHGLKDHYSYLLEYR